MRDTFVRVLAGERDGSVPSLQLEHHHDDENGREQVHHVLASVPEEGVAHSGMEVFREQFVNEVYEDALKGGLVVIASDGNWRENLPHDALCDVDRDEHADPVAQPVLVHHFIQQHCDD